VVVRVVASAIRAEPRKKVMGYLIDGHHWMGVNIFIAKIDAKEHSLE